MSVISTQDRDTYHNSARAELKDVALNVMPLVELASATVTATPVYPMASLAVGSTVDWQEAQAGRLFSIERADGSQVVTWGVLRKDAAAAVLFPDVKSAGDFGYATHDGIRVAVGDIVRVYSARPIWAILSRVDETIVQFKGWDSAYAEEGVRPFPVVNMGSHRAGFVDSRGYLRLELDGGDSYDWLAGAGGISMHEWTLPAGAIVVSGSTTDSALTVDFPPGLGLEIALTVTSVNGRQATGYRFVFANERDPDSDYAPINYRYAVSAVSDSQNVTGREMSYTIAGDLSGVMFPGALGIMSYRVAYDGETLNDAVTVNTFVGYLETADWRGAKNEYESTYTFLGPLRLAQNLPAATQLIEEAAAPDDWQEVAVGLCDPAFATYYILKNHTTILALHDYKHAPAMRLLRRPGYAFPQLSIFPQLQFVAETAAGYIGAMSNGTIRLEFIPDLLSQNDPTRSDYNPDFDRDALDVKFEWDDRSLDGPLTINPVLRPPVSEIRINAIAYAGESDPPLFGSKAPGYHVAQGISKQDLADVTVTPQGRETDLYRISGHWFAYLNNPLQDVSQGVFASLDILEPAEPDWHALTAPLRYWPAFPNHFGVRLDTGGRVRFRPETVNRQWQNRGGSWSLKINSSIRFESKGQPGVYWPIERDGAAAYTDYDGWLPDLDFTLPDITVDLDLDVTFDTAILLNDFGFLSSTFNWLDQNLVNYGFIGLGLPNQIIDIAWVFGTAAIDLYVVTHDTDGGGSSLYYSADIETFLPVYSLERTNTGDAPNARVLTDPAGLRLFAAAAQIDGVNVLRRSGPVWDLGVAVGDPYPPAAGGDNPLAVALDGADSYIAAYNSGAGVWRVFKAVGAAGAYAELPNHPGDNAGSLGQPLGLWLNSSYIFVTYDLDFNGAATAFADITSVKVDNETASSGVFSDSEIIRLSRYRYQLNYPSRGTTFNIESVDLSVGVSQWYDNFDSSGPAWLPPATPEYNIDMYLRVTLFGDDNTPLVTLNQDFNPGTGAGVSSAVNSFFPASGGFDRIRRISTVTINTTLPAIVPGVLYAEFEVATKNPVDFPSGGFITNDPTQARLGLAIGDQSGQNILFYDGFQSEGKRLYRLDKAGLVWTDISPEGVRYPARVNALAVDGSNLWGVFTDDITGRRYIMTSTNDGASWQEVKEVNFEWLKRLAANTFVLGGFYSLAVTRDNFASFSNRLGDYWSSVGNPETIINLLSKGEL